MTKKDINKQLRLAKKACSLLNANIRQLEEKRFAAMMKKIDKKFPKQVRTVSL